MVKDNDGILSFINFSKLSLITNKLKEKLGKCVKGVEKKSKERSQYLKWIVSLYESLPPYVDKTDINDSQLQAKDKTPQDLLNDFSALLASFINCGLVTTNELEYGEYTTVPPLKEGISYWSDKYLVNYAYVTWFLDIANYLLERFYNKRHCSTYRLKSEDKRKNAFDEEDEDDENTVSRSSSTR